jgi:Zn-dependent protease with chaperone function/Tfp pilus assembly major pilin PilA
MDLVFKNEKPLFVLSMVIGTLVWLALVVGTFGIALIYVLLFLIIYLFAHSGFIAYLRGNTLELSESQFPDLYRQYLEACERLEIKEIPTAYLMMSDGVLNALATRFLRRHYVVLFSSVVEALRSRPDALRFYFGHELAHIKRGHLDLQWLKMPASVLPLLGAAYRRAQEYTCDLHGLAASNSREDALAALAVLGTGGEKLSAMNVHRFIDQQRYSSGFWMSYHELTNDYPWLSKRLAHIAAVSGAGDGQVAQYKAPARSFLAGVFAAFTPRFGVGGGASVLVLVAIIGVLAAIAIPAYQDYTLRAQVAAAMPLISQVEGAGAEYVNEHKVYPESPTDVGLPETMETGPVSHIQVIDEGFELTLRSTHQLLNEKTIVVGAYQNDDGSIQWHCVDGTLDQKYRPQNADHSPELISGSRPEVAAIAATSLKLAGMFST